MTESYSGTHLTISRVNRLLRPLRNKCNSLAALSKPATASHITYLKQSANWNPDNRPPLALLCSSSGTKKSRLENCSTDEFEVSRRICAVCDAFKNIAHVAHDQPCTRRIPSLAAMCTLVVGENISAVNSDGPLADSSEDSTDEDDVLDVDSIYEAVPPHYRRFLITSHALTMILCICDHHHGLVTILLDRCLLFGLVRESTHLLDIVLAQAFISSIDSTYPPPVTHPAHTSYLLDLHTKWVVGNKPYGTPLGPSLFTTSAFCHAVLSTLSQTTSCNSFTLWTSKVLDRLFHAIAGCDIDSYIHVIHALSRAFWKTLGSSPDVMRDDAQVVMLRDKLSELMLNLFDLLFPQHESHPSPATPSRTYAVVDMLLDCNAARLHRLRMSTPGSPIDLSDIIITLTTHIFVAFRDSINDSDHLLTVLDDSTPVPNTFSKLMVYLSRLQESQASDDPIKPFLTELKVYSSVFRSEKLFALDASLWACALRHFETTLVNSQKGGPVLLARYKRQLMEAVDAAERRCFGGDIDSSPIISLSAHSNRARRSHRGKLDGNWEWEDMVGSWIRKTPMHKKRKVDGDHPYTSLQHIRSRPQSPRTSKAVLAIHTPLSTRPRCSTTSSPSSSFSLLSELESHTETESEYQDESDKENYSSNPPLSVQRPVKRRSSNFSSLLADAQTNRIVLHSRRQPKSKPPSSVIHEKYVCPLSSQESRHASRKQEVTLLPSDDSLNLFAYATSSPARC